ncbi:hypothetical protein [Aureispira anguillae]|uniref:DUF4279 domain-containing protein n=1 Tax=Aureispira anguillae TaxID=2864201 RepID=A0A916DW82_9BACT|nr:hypothetical protein [Aureispira anguillae]BDS15186.1 hypothetical protein AsAng_0059700 [Aureispira anguillae]
MCIFHVTSKTSSFQQFLSDHPELPVYQSHEKGDIPKISTEEIAYDDFGFSCEVSDRPWGDMEGQIIDMISFLEVYSPYLRLLQKHHSIDDWRFDLPYECRLGNNHFTQCDYLPPKLMRLAGALEIGIELSLYWPSAEENIEDDDTITAHADTDNE